MENNSFLNDYMNQAVKQLIGDILKTTLQNPKATMFLLGMQQTIAEARKKRERYEAEGIHVPLFLISSITRNCNLFCKGCYARSNGICGTEKPQERLLTADEWEHIFRDAAQMGVSFNLLAGGEPMIRKDILTCASKVKEMIFPIFTNGTLLDKEYVDFIADNPNLVPVISMEGFEQQTDERRGTGIYRKLTDAMALMKKKRVLYGVSVTITTANYDTVTSAAFLDELRNLGCRLVFYIEYVPVDKGTEHLALTEQGKEQLERKLVELKGGYPGLFFFSFPGDEQYLGGCLAAGRAFFHINSNGNAEPCPFSPYSDRNLLEHSLEEVLQSPFFQKLRIEGLVGGEHTGGCVLFEKEEEVKRLFVSPQG